MEETEKDSVSKLSEPRYTHNNRDVVFVVLLLVLGIAAGILIWFQKSTYENLIQQLEYNVSSTKVIQEQESDAAEFEPCFGEESFAQEMDTTNWVSFQGTGFDIRHPKEMRITLADSGYNNRNTIEYTAAMSGQNISIRVYKLEHAIFRNKVLYTPEVTYEVNSNTWWRGKNFNPAFNPTTAVQCEPNESGRTMNGDFPVYRSGGGGDVGTSFVEYAIVMRDVAGIVGLSTREPVIITFILSSGGDFSPIQGYILREVIENMIIQTIDVGGTSKG
jgi:hypothetical protein